MTDNEIIKAYEEIIQTKAGYIWQDVLDLLNRQKAEVERLTNKNDQQAEMMANLGVELTAMRSAANSYKSHYENAKSEAIKEFAEKIKQVLELNDLQEYKYVCKLLDVLVKEMVGENDG